MRIRTDGDFQHRKQTVEDTADAFGTRDKTRAVLLACEHATHDVRNKRKALRYLETHVAGKHVEKVAELLSTPHVRCHYEFDTAVEPNP